MKYENGQFVLYNTEPAGSHPGYTNATVREFNIQYWCGSYPSVDVGLDINRTTNDPVQYAKPSVSKENFSGQVVPRSASVAVAALSQPLLQSDTAKLDFTLNGEVVSVTRTVGAGGAANNEAVAALFSGQTVTLSTGERFTASIDSVDKNKIIWTSNSTTELGAPTVSNMGITLTRQNRSPVSQGIAYPAGDVRGWAMDVSSNDVVLSDGVAGIKAGDVFTIDGQEYELVSGNGQKQREDAVVVLWNGPNRSTLADLVASLQSAIDQTGGKFTVKEYGAGGFTLTQTKDGVGDVEAQFASAPVKLSTMEIDPYRLKDGDEVAVTLTDKYGEEKQSIYVHRKGNSFEDIKSYFAQSFNGYTSVTGKSNKIMFDVGGIDVKFWPIKEAHGELRIQVGALENEQLSIGIDSMNTAGLGLDGVVIDTQDKAGSAITSVRSAIDQVSDQRAMLGAMQNRLEHKMQNLSIAVENLQYAESRIRDVDMADEMAKLTISNILMQATVSMLSQANASPQNVLSLLR